MRVTKYHGLGNDFIITTQKEVQNQDLSKLAINLCDRHAGIGADGLIVVKTNQLEMVYYNSDGSRAKMCGNGIRCFSKFIYDEGINRDTSFVVYTLAGHLTIEVKSFEPYLCEVNMGTADYSPKNIPVLTEKEEFVDEVVTVDGEEITLTSLLLGATHTIIEVDELDTYDVYTVGKTVTEMDMYPDSTNVNFYQRVNKSEIKMITYERGAGLTLACGTGASAVVAHLLKDKNKGSIKVQLPLGYLLIRKDDKGHIYMEGPAEKILDGKFGD